MSTYENINYRATADQVIMETLGCPFFGYDFGGMISEDVLIRECWNLANDGCYTDAMNAMVDRGEIVEGEVDGWDVICLTGQTMPWRADGEYADLHTA